MASLLTPRQASGRPRATSNGGLGGCVQAHIADMSLEDPIETGTWPKRRKKRPPPLKISYGSDELLVPAPQRSALWQNSKSPWSPKTPTSYGGSDTSTARLVVMGAPSSTLLSRFNNSAFTPSNPPSRSFTPTRIISDPVELPGSLLLPSQGLEPPPFTPPRPLNLLRRDTDDSEFSSAPSLTSSTSSCFSEMERLNLWKAVSSSVTPMAPPAVSKPFATMSIEELLEALPKCNTNTNTFTQMWLPAMKEKHDAMKGLLQKSIEGKVDSTAELADVGKDLMRFTQEARAISNTYLSALKSAESLVERDTNHLEEALRIYERKLREERIKGETSSKVIREKELAVIQLDSTLRDVVGTLGAFIQEHIPQWADSFQDSRTQTVMQIIADYSNIVSDSAPRHVRIPEATHNKILASLRDANINVQKYRTISSNQNSMLKEQNVLGERQSLKYEQCLKTVKERNREIVLLGEKRAELETKVDEYEVALMRSEAAVLEREHLQKRNAELEAQMTSMREVIDERDALIAELRSKLGSAREEVIARRADVRNVIVQSQAMQVQTEPSDTSSQSSGSKARKILGRSKEKPKTRQLFPHSSSGLPLGFGKPLNPDLMSSPPDTKYSSKEVVSKQSKSNDVISSVSSTASSLYSQDSKDTARPYDHFQDIQLRADSLGAPNGVGKTVRSPQANTQKQLPTPPPTILATPPPNHAPPTTPQDDSPMAKTSNRREHQAYPDYSPQPTARRILSDIPEASVEDVDSPRAPSATSSDREAFRHSMHALNALSDFEESARMSERATKEGTLGAIERVETQSSDGSEPQTVSEMYHDGRKGYWRS